MKARIYLSANTESWIQIPISGIDTSSSLILSSSINPCRRPVPKYIFPYGLFPLLNEELIEVWS